MMVRKKNNSLITNSQENMDNFAETTSSLLQRDVDTATSLPSRLYTQDVNFELLEYRMKTLEESVRELKKEIAFMGNRIEHVVCVVNLIMVLCALFIAIYIF